MLKSADVKHTDHAALRHDRLAAVEEQFDKAIKKAEMTAQWPAVVTTKRDDVTIDEIAHVIQQYRDAGWIVGSGRGDVRATIDHPARSRT